VSDGLRSRWSSPQPNVPGVGILAGYSPLFWTLVVTLGVAAGAAAVAMLALLKLVERLSYGNLSNGYLAAVRAAPDWRHVVVLLLAAAIVVAGGGILGRLPISGGGEVSEALWMHGGRLDAVASIARALLSIVTVGMGVSLGREAAPQLLGAATASKLSDWARLPVWQRRLLVASGTGAAFGAVYNVPLGGTLLALEVLLGTLALPLVLPALMTSVIATAVAWTVLGTGPTYRVPTYPIHPSQLVWAALVGPLLGLVAVAWTQLITRASAARPRRGAARVAAPFAAFGALALLSIPYPQLLGNGKDIVQLAVVGSLSLGTFAALFGLKPLATAGCLGAGSPGGLFTPTFAIGALFAGVAGIAWSHIWHGAPVGSYALIGGGALLAAAMQGPLSGTVLVLELTRHLAALMVPTLLAVSEATFVARRFGAHSIYSARLGDGHVEADASPTASAAAVATLHALDDALPHEATRPPSR
jgi:chloride channel protein, CIC family